jgi:hypothetical protein
MPIKTHPNLDFDPSAVIKDFLNSIQQDYRISSSQQFLKLLIGVSFVLVILIGVQLFNTKGRNRRSAHVHRD